MAPPEAVQGLVDKLQPQKGITIEQQIVEGANHFFAGHVDELIETCAEYLDRRLGVRRGRLARQSPETAALPRPE